MTVRRVKTYMAQSGYVYQYYFVGSRPALDGSAATEYIFDVTSDRKKTFAVTVLLLEEALTAWAGLHGRELTDTERYATAKMRLQRGFDEHPDMFGEGRWLQITAFNVEELLEPLDLS